MKRFVLSLLSTFLIFGIILGCSSESKNNLSSSEPKPADTTKQVTIQFSFYGDDARKQMLEGIIEKFNEEYPQIKVETILIPNTEYLQKIAIMAASNTAPDVAWFGEAMVPQFIEGDQLMDLSMLKSDEQFNFEDIFPTSLNAFEYDGKIYGIPFSSAPRVVFFNKKLFAEKNVKTPLEQVAEGNWTYDEYLKTAQQLTDASNGVYGASLITIQGWKRWQSNFTDTIWAFGGKLFSDDGSHFALNTPEGEQAFQFISDLIFKHQVHPKPGDQLSFESGKIAMSRQEYSYINNAVQIKDFEYDIAPMPSGPVESPSGVGVSAYTIFKNTKHPDEALAFLKFMTGEYGAQLLAGRFVAPRESFLKSEAFIQANPTVTQEGIQRALIDVFNKGVKVQDSHKNFAAIDTNMQIAFDSLYTQSSPKDVLNIMETSINTLMKE